MRYAESAVASRSLAVPLLPKKKKKWKKKKKKKKSRGGGETQRAEPVSVDTNETGAESAST